jgi:hypothetical protein
MDVVFMLFLIIFFIVNNIKKEGIIYCFKIFFNCKNKIIIFQNFFKKNEKTNFKREIRKKFKVIT